MHGLPEIRCSSSTSWTRSAARDEIGEAGETDWALLEEKALAVGRWHQVVVAGRVRAMHRADTDLRAALQRLDAAVELASAHGLTEQAGWANTRAPRRCGCWGGTMRLIGPGHRARGAVRLPAAGVPDLDDPAADRRCSR